MLLTAMASIVGLVLLIGGLLVLAERSLARQQGSMLRRGRDERNAASRFATKIGRWGSGSGDGA